MLKSHPVLLYSGGRESIILLHQMVKEGLKPTIFHIHHTRMSNYYERIVRRNAMRIQKTEAYYVWKTDNYRYRAGWRDHHYFIYLDNNKELYPIHYGSPVYIGYWKEDNHSQKYCVEDLQFWNEDKYKFPLADFSWDDIQELWKELPQDVRDNTVSSSMIGWSQAKSLPYDQTLMDASYHNL